MKKIFETPVMEVIRFIETDIVVCSCGSGCSSDCSGYTECSDDCSGYTECSDDCSDYHWSSIDNVRALDAYGYY